MFVYLYNDIFIYLYPFCSHCCTKLPTAGISAGKALRTSDAGWISASKAAPRRQKGLLAGFQPAKQLQEGRRAC